MNRYVVYPIKDTLLYVQYDGVWFYFSTPTNKNKFEDRLINFVEDESIKFENKRGVSIDLKIYFGFVLYRIIEKRGFKVNFRGKELESWQQVKFVFVPQI